MVIVQNKFKKYHRWFNRHRKNSVNVVAILALSVVGYSLIVLTKAATPTDSFEVESGIKTLGARVISDGTASSGSAILFGSIETNKSRLGVDINELPPGISMSQAYDTIKSLGFGWVRTGPGISN